MTTLETEDDLTKCLEASRQTAVFILKHSTRCPISSDALREVKDYIEEGAGEEPPVYLNYVVESRAISNRLAELLGLRHESPQIFLVSGGKAVWHASHSGITASAMERAYGNWTPSTTE